MQKTFAQIMADRDRNRQVFDQRMKDQDREWIAFIDRLAAKAAREKKELIAAAAKANVRPRRIETSATSKPFAMLLKKEE